MSEPSEPSVPTEAPDSPERPTLVRRPQLAYERLGSWLMVGHVVNMALRFLPGVWALLPIAAGALALLGGRALHRPAKRRLRVDAEHLHLEATKGAVNSIPLRSIVHAEILYVDRKPRLRLLSKHHALLLELHLDSTEEVTSWIRSLGLDARARELSTRVPVADLAPAEIGAMLVASGLTWAASAIFGGALSLWDLMPVLPYAVTSVLSRQRVVVGAEGVEIRTWRGPVFHRFEDVADVIRVDLQVFLVLHDGTRVALPFSDDRKAEGLIADAHWTLQRALLAFREGSDRRSLDVLARGDRSVTEWIAHLEGLARGDYRSAALTRERLEAAVADPRAEESVRAGAAWLLARQGHDTAVQVARDRAAAPRVRVALEAALEENVEVFDEASRGKQKTA